MQINNIKITNFRKIEHMELEFKPGFNLLIGDNSVGKTSVLEAIAVALGGFLSGINGVKTIHFSSDEIRRVNNLTGEGSNNIEYKTPIIVECDMQLNNKQFKFIRKKNSVKSSRSTVEPKDICKEAADLVQRKNSILPVVSYQSASRMWVQKKDKWNNPFGDDFSRIVGYTDCLDESSNTKMMTNWCKKMEQVSWQLDKKIKEYESAKSTVSHFISCMTGFDNAKVFYDKRTEELMCIIGEEVLPLRLLSAGYRSMIGMVFDIAYRMSVLNPDLLENTGIASGVVLVDELDLHLHPKWQWKIISALESTFPNIQFIATTHSPIILSSYKGENIIYINNDSTAEYKQSAYGYQVNDILDLVQGSNIRVPDIQSKFSDFYKAIDENQIEKAESILNELKAKCKNGDPDIVGAQTTLELEKMDI